MHYYKILYSSLCYIVGPCWFSILYIVVLQWTSLCFATINIESKEDYFLLLGVCWCVPVSKVRVEPYSAKTVELQFES